MGTIAGVGGLFIGLYYNGLTAVGTAIYSKTPNNIRDLLARERTGSTYMGYLSYVTFFALGLIAMNMFGLGPLRLAALFMVLLAGVGIFVFVALGQSAFNYFDPTELSKTFIFELQSSFKKVTTSGFFFKDPSIQNHLNKVTSAAISTLKTLTDIIEKQEHLNGQSFFDFSKMIVRLLIYYQNQKKRIPTKSFWYDLKYQHPDWYTSDYTSVELAQNTGTSISPKSVQDNYWLENDLLTIPIKCFEINLKAKRLELAIDVVRLINHYLKALAENGEVNTALDLVERLLKIHSENLGEVSPGKEESVKEIAIFETLLILKAEILIAFSAETQKLSPEKISERIKKIEWVDSKSIYSTNFPPNLLADLEWLQKTILFELDCEGEILSPQWYQAELVILFHAQKINENIDCLFKRSKTLKSKNLKDLSLQKRPWHLSCFISHELEYINKTYAHFSRLSEVWKSLIEKRHIKKLPWPKLEFSNLFSDLDSQKKELIKMLPQAVKSLSPFKRTEEFPDYLGQFLNLMGESILEYCTENKMDLANELYPGYFEGCILKFGQLFPDSSLEGRNFENAYTLACGPILELIELSGYVKLFSEYYGNDSSWDVIKDIWDKYLSDQNAPKKMESLASILRSDEQNPGLSPSSLHRTGWSQMTYRFLRENVMKAFRQRKSIPGVVDFIRPEEIALHQSPLVRIFSEGDFSCSFDGGHIFISEYLLKRADSKGVNFKGSWKDLTEAIKREAKNNTFVKDELKKREQA
ncbi:MAG TPA: hypothetical protein VHE12_03380 [bacterium]|nr:hypothetical protein [bacterium]